MSDYVLHNRERFKDSTVLELGAGVGVVSIVACLTGAKYVLCTGLCKVILNAITHMPPLPAPHTLTFTHTPILTRYWKSSIGYLSEKCPS